MEIIQWVVIGVFILVGLWYLKMEHHTRKVKIIVLIVIGALIYFSMIGIFSSEKVDLTSPRGVINSVYIYFGWIGQTATTLWDIGADPELGRLLAGHDADVRCGRASPDGRLVATGGADKTIVLFDAKTGRLIRKLAGHTDAVTAIADAKLAADGIHRMLCKE